MTSKPAWPWKWMSMRPWIMGLLYGIRNPESRIRLELDGGRGVRDREVVARGDGDGPRRQRRRVGSGAVRALRRNSPRIADRLDRRRGRVVVQPDARVRLKRVGARGTPVPEIGRARVVGGDAVEGVGGDRVLAQ